MNTQSENAVKDLAGLPKLDREKLDDLQARVRSLQWWLDWLDKIGRRFSDSPSRGLGTIPSEYEQISVSSLKSVTEEIVGRYEEYKSLAVRSQVERELRECKEKWEYLIKGNGYLRAQSGQLDSEDPFDLDALQTNLAAGEVVLDYYVGPSTLYVGVISRNGLNVIHLPVTDPRELIVISRDLINLANKILNPDLEVHIVSSYSLATGMQRCSAWLFPEELVAFLTALKTERLYIVASGPLWRIPFGWLEADGKLALERWEICIVPSARLAGREERQQAHEQTVVVGHPGSPYLPFVGEEVRSVSSLLKGRSLFETDATPQRILREVLPEAGIIHFACHGFCDPISPLTSSLLLEPDDQHPDGRLMFYEILSVPLRAQVVSLGACHTAESEGPTSFPESLSHAFLGAGARFVIASFWAALDDEARNFAHDFYAALSQKAEPAVAFRQAQLQQAARLRSTSRRSDYASFSDRDFAEMANFVLLGARRM